MVQMTRADILKLSIAERIELVGDIWDSIAEAGEEVELSDSQKSELDRRLDAHREDPAGQTAWSVVRRRIRER
jgi:putative addiction module component (TIGR02574 family)